MANTLYTAGSGTSGTGDTYSFGVAGAHAVTERALGNLGSMSMIPIFGASFVNSAASPIAELLIAYVGELWRLGDNSGRLDRLDFQYSLNATSLTTGTWIDVNELDFVTPNTIGDVSGPAAARDGNAAGFRTAISFNITGLTIASGATFWIRWNDFNATGTDDGLAVDDFSIKATAGLPGSLAIGDATMAEGNSGTTAFTFTVARSGGSSGTVSASWTLTLSGTANAADFATFPQSGTVSFANGETSKTITIAVQGDILFEQNETFSVILSTPTGGATIGDTTGDGTITNDDVAPPPSVDLNGAGAGTAFAGSFAEGGAGAAIGSGIAVTAPALPIVRAIVTITDALAGDVLAIVGTLPATILVDPASTASNLILTGTGSTAAWAVALSLVRYSSGSDNPDTYGTDPARTINVTVSDGLQTSPAAIATIAIEAVDDAPVVGNFNGDSVTYTEGDPYVLLDRNLPATVVDPDSPDFAGGSFSIGVQINPNAQDEFFILGVVNVGLVGNAVYVDGFLIGTITSAGPGQLLTISFNAAATAERVATLIDQLAYRNLAGDTPTPGLRSISYLLNDGDGGVAGGAVTVNVVAVPDPPTIDLDGPGGNANYATSVTEGDAGVAIVDNDVDIVSIEGGITLVTVTLTDHRAGDELYYDSGFAGADISGSLYDAATGVLTLTGSGTPAQWEGALTHLRFRNTTDDPTFESSDPARSITFVARDGGGNSNIATTTVVINAIDDAATIGGTDTGTVTEDVSTNASGRLTVTDVDGADAFVPIADMVYPYGRFTLAADGAWSYALDHDATNSIPGGEDRSETISVSAADGTFHDVTITIHGTNDSAMIGGADAGIVAEDSTLTASGALTVSDVDTGESSFRTQSNVATAYGHFSIDANGAWRYDLDNSNAAVQALATGETLVDTIQVLALDGTSQAIIITINGADEPIVPPTIDLDNRVDGIDYATSYTENDPGILIGHAITITAPGGMIHGAAVTLNGAVLGDRLAFVGALPAGVTIAGMNDFQISFSGTATTAQYEALLAAIVFLNSTEDPAEFSSQRTVTVTVFDDQASSAEAVATIDVVGVNDIAAITGDMAGSATENSSVAVSGMLACVDADFNESRVQASSLFDSYGSFSIAENGAWSFSPNANDALRGGQIVTDTFRVLSYDGSASADIVITITGLNDVPSVFPSDPTGAATEDDDLQNTAEGFLIISDPDAGENQWQSGTFVTAYGTYVVQADGDWTYTLNNGSAATQGLRGGAATQDLLQVFSFDGTASLTLDVTISGVNDLAAITGANTGQVAEDGQLAASGTLVISDADDGESKLQPLTAAGAGGYGLFEIGADGIWTYALNNAHPDVQALDDGQTLTDSILVMSEDGTGTETIVVTINGRTEANRPPIVDHEIGTQYGIEDEAVFYQVPADTFFDGDGDTLTYSAALANGDPLPTWLGFDESTRTFSGTPPLDYFGILSLRVVASDGEASAYDDFDLVIEPVNDAPAGSDHRIGIAEDSIRVLSAADFPFADVEGHGLGFVSIDSVSGGTLSYDADGAGDGDPVAVTGFPVGILKADLHDGKWRFVPTPNANGSGTGVITFRVSDDGGAPGDETDPIANTLVIDVAAVNDAPVNSVPGGQAVLEDEILTFGAANGNAISIVDIDSGASPLQVTISVAHGTLTLSGLGGLDILAGDGTEDATITFAGTAADINAALNGLVYAPDADHHGGDAIAITTSDQGATGTGNFLSDTDMVAIAVDPVNDAPSGMDHTITIDEDSIRVLTIADFPFTDVEGHGLRLVFIDSVSGGTLRCDADGAGGGEPVVLTSFPGVLLKADLDDGKWSFVPTPNASGTGTGMIAFRISDDGGAPGDETDPIANLLAINVAAINDAPLGTDATRTIAEDASYSFAAGDFGFSDPVEGHDFLGVIIASLPENGTLTLNGIAVNAGQEIDVTEIALLLFTPAANASGDGYGKFTFQVRDDGGVGNGGIDTDQSPNLFTVTITPVNDPASITGDVLGDVTEAGGVNSGTPGQHSDTGNLDATDPDNAADAWQIVSTQTASANGYGTFMITADGQWTYSLDNGNSAVQALNVGGTLSDSFTVLTADGTQQVVTIVISGANDAASITGDALGDVTEAGGVANGTAGVLTDTGDLDATDVDNPADTWQAVAAGGVTTNGYGTYQLTAAGVWTYTLDDNNPLVQALNGAATLTDTFTALTQDGTGQLVTVTIHAQNDAALITGDALGDVTEAGGVANGSAGIPTDTGDLNATDADNPADTWQAVAAGGVTANGYGSYQLSAAGVWTYTLDNNNALVQALNGASTLTDSFTAMTTDGTGQLVTVTIHAQNDAPVITGDANGDVTEAGAVNGGTPTDTGDLNADDDDNPDDVWQAVAAGGATGNGYGTYQLSAAGVWTYTLDNNNALVQALNGAATLTDTFTALTQDGTAQVVTILIHAQNDNAVISGDSSGDVFEAGGVANGAAGTPSDTGDLNSTDVDNSPDDVWVAVAAGSATANGYGSYQLSAAGVWTYTLDNSNAAVQALAAGATATDSFTAVTADGSSQLVTVTIHGANDAPVLGSVAAAASYTEDSAPTVLSMTLTVSDVDDSDLESAQVAITANFAAGDTLTIGAATSGTVGALSYGYNSGTGMLTITGHAPLANYQMLLDQVAFSTASQNPSTAARTISWTANDGTIDSATGTTIVSVVSVNDPPTGTDRSATGSEDDPLVFTVADFMTGFSDPEGNAFAGIVVTSLPGQGILYRDADGLGGPGAPVAVVVGDFISADDLANQRLYFIPDADEFGPNYTSFQFKVRDNAGGADTAVAANTMTINITPDNQPPAVDLNGAGAGIDASVSYTEDSAGVAIGTSITVTDPDSGLGDQIESATITLTDRVAGDSLTLTGALPAGIVSVTTSNAGSITITITGPGTGAQYQALIQSIRYSTTNQDPTFGGTDTQRTITVTVSDRAVDSAVATSTITITPANDPAVAQPDAFTTNENAALSGNVFPDNGAGADSDIDGPALMVGAVNDMAVVGVQITLASGATLKLNADGTFTYNPGTAFNALPDFAASGASNTTGTDSFTYTLVNGDTVTVSLTIRGVDSNGDVLLGMAGVDTLNGGIGADTMSGLGGNDYVDGGNDNDDLYGGADNDILFGGSGSDYLDGGLGRDAMSGGTGDDVYILDNAGDYAVEVLEEGRDTIYALVSYILTAGTSVEVLAAFDPLGTESLEFYGNELASELRGNAGANVLGGAGGADVLFGLGGIDALLGGSGSDYLDGGSANDGLFGDEDDDVLIGGAGSDYLDGGLGSDRAYGGSGNDYYLFDAESDVGIEAAGEGRDVAFSSVSYVLTAGSEVEVLAARDAASLAALDLHGNEYGNELWGSEGANVLGGEGDNDALLGFGGDDTLLGGTGADYLDGGAGDDGLFGEDGDDLLQGGSGADRLDGGTGNDAMYGGTGDDVYIFDSGDDFAIEDAGQGFDIVYTGVDCILTAGSDVEVLAAHDAAGNGPLDLYGNGLANQLWGNQGANLLSGEDGADTLFGLGGNDTLIGGAGSDILDGGAGQDVFLFNTDLGLGQIDTVAGFSSADDTILLENAVFTTLASGSLPAGQFAIGTQAVDADDRIVYDSATGALYYDADGSGAGVQIQFAILHGAPTLNESYFFVI